MKRYIFTQTRPDKKGNVTGNIFRVKDNDIFYITDFSFRLGSCRGAKHEAFNALMDCGEIPRKWYTSSRSEWSGDGYFYGEVEKHYDIKEAF